MECGILYQKWALGMWIFVCLLGCCIVCGLLYDSLAVECYVAFHMVCGLMYDMWFFNSMWAVV